MGALLPCGSVLEAISSPSADPKTVSRVFEITLSTLKKSANNERLWFSTYVRYGKACLRSQDYVQLNKVVVELHKSCQLENGSDDPTKGTNLLEVYALEIQWCSETSNTARMKIIYPKTLNLNAAVADPRIMGCEPTKNRKLAPACGRIRVLRACPVVLRRVIREEGGKMYMGEQKWNLAYEEFYEGFRGYQVRLRSSGSLDGASATSPCKCVGSLSMRPCL